MPDPSVTQLLEEWRLGSEDARDRLMPIVYEHLRTLAARLMVSERPNHTLPATALVHEAYLQLAGAEVGWQDRAHFFALAARLMRRILVDYAKANRRIKRGGEAVKVSLEEVAVMTPGPSAVLADVDEALERLLEFDERKGKLIELIYFGGLTYDEAAQALEISPATVDRELRLAKAWLYGQLSESIGN